MDLIMIDGTRREIQNYKSLTEYIIQAKVHPNPTYCLHGPQKRWRYQYCRYPLIGPWVLTCLISHLLLCILTALSDYCKREFYFFQILQILKIYEAVYFVLAVIIYGNQTVLHIDTELNCICNCWLPQTILKM